MYGDNDRRLARRQRHWPWGLALLMMIGVLAVMPTSSTCGDEAFEALEKLEARYTEFRNAGRFREALPIARQMVEFTQQNMQDRPELIAVSLENLGFLNLQLGNLDEAERIYKQTLPTFEQLFGADHNLVAQSCNDLANVYFAKRRFGEAIALYGRSSEIFRKNDGPASAGVALAEQNTAGAYLELGLYRESEASFRRALALREKLYGAEHLEVADTLNSLANLLQEQGRFPEAARLYQRALTIRQRSLTPDHPRVADVLNNLGNLAMREGRFTQAESFYQRSLAMRRKVFGDLHPDVGQSLNNLGIIAFDQGRYPEAEKYYREAAAIRAKSLGAEHPVVADTLGNLGNLLDAQRRYADAEPAYRRALAIYQKSLPPEHPRIALLYMNLASLELALGRKAEADKLNRQALAIYEKVYGAENPDSAQVLHNLAIGHLRSKEYAAALPLITKAIEMRDRLLVNAAHRSSSYLGRAEIQWQLGQRDAALADLRRAMELAEQQRGRTSGAEQDRGKSFEQLTLAFEIMSKWQTELQNPAAAMEAIERGRARSLVDQLQTQGVDLLADLPAAEADELRQRDAVSKQAISSLEKQLELLDRDQELSTAERTQRYQALMQQLAAAQEEAVAIYRDMRNRSPAYQLAVSRDFQPLGLDELQAWVNKQDALLLEYLIGETSSQVLIVPASGPARIESIQLAADQAKALGVQPGELTASKLGQIWQLGESDIVEALAAPTLSAAGRERLAQLYQLLIPATLRDELTSEKFKRLFIVPDGRLNNLPFDTLIVQSGAETKYLLDVGPPIIYAPSATVLVNLERRTLKATPGAQPVLTVADALYGPEGAGPSPEEQLASNSRSRYYDGGGPLEALPFTGTESNWVVTNFKSEGIAAAGLRGAMATEANVRANVAGREFLHFACHGLVDQRYGNFFGALALTPGKAASGPADDGFLTLPEIYVLPLTGCELSILSACQTNVGLQQRGEGLFGLSRGFLVAGSRRVVASNWLVDDEAAASLVSYFTAGLAKADRAQGPIGYAESLHAAKRWIRGQEKWNSPYYWGTFVLIGPN